MFLKSLFAVIGSVAALAGSSKLSSSLKKNVAAQTSQEVVEPASVEIKEEVVSTPAPVVSPSEEVEAKVEVTPESKSEKLETKEPIYYGRYTLKKYFAGGRGHRHAAYILKTNFFGQAESIKRNDSATWNDFVAAATNTSTDEDILESACKNLSNRDKISFDGREYFKNKIKGYCFTQIGWKL